MPNNDEQSMPRTRDDPVRRRNVSLCLILSDSSASNRLGLYLKLRKPAKKVTLNASARRSSYWRTRRVLTCNEVQEFIILYTCFVTKQMQWVSEKPTRYNKFKRDQENKVNVRESQSDTLRTIRTCISFLFWSKLHQIYGNISLRSHWCRLRKTRIFHQ
jgi:hypothetical protein